MKTTSKPGIKPVSEPTQAAQTKPQRIHRPPPRGIAQSRRDCIRLRNLTDCLLEAYDSVACLAYQKYVDHGSLAGGEIDDWLSAESDLLGDLRVDLQDAETCVTALASLPGLSAAQVQVAIEPCWLAILGRRTLSTESSDFNADPGDVAIWASAIRWEALAARRTEIAKKHRTSLARLEAEYLGLDPMCHGIALSSDSTGRAAVARELYAQRIVHKDVHGDAYGGVQSEARGDAPDEVVDAERENVRRNQRGVFSGRNRRGVASRFAVHPDSGRGVRSAATPFRTENHNSCVHPAPGPYVALKVFCLVALPAEVDPQRSIAVLSDGVLGIRMLKPSTS